MARRRSARVVWGAMKYWVQSLPSGANVIFRGASDPFDDDDVALEFWNSNERRWIPDADIAEDLIWDPWVREVTEPEVRAWIGNIAA